MWYSNGYRRSILGGIYFSPSEKAGSTSAGDDKTEDQDSEDDSSDSSEDKNSKGSSKKSKSKSDKKSSKEEDNNDDEDDDEDTKEDKAKSSKKDKLKSDKKFTKDDVENIVQNRLAEEKKKTDREKLSKQGEFEKLYNETLTELETLKEVKTKYDGLISLLNETIDEQTEKWPEELKDLDPGSDNYELRQKWFNKATRIVSKLEGKENKKVFNPEHKQKEHKKEEIKASDTIMSGYKPPKFG